MQKTLAYIAVVFSMIFWAFSFIWSKGALEIYGPLTILTFRLIIASILLLSISKATGLLNPIKKQDWKFFFLLSFFEPFLYFLGETYGLSLVSPTIAAVMIATIPLFLPYMAWYVFGERITKFKTFGTVFSFVGVLLVMVNYNMELNANIWGILLLLLAVASAIGYTAVLNKLSHNYNVVTIVSWQSTLGLIGFAPLFALIGMPHTPATGWQWAGIKPYLPLANIGCNLGFLPYTHSIKILGMTRSGVFTNGIPVLTSLFSFLLLGEQLLTINYIGIAIVVGGLFLSQLREKGR